jgi:hypothetical protein
VRGLLVALLAAAAALALLVAPVGSVSAGERDAPAAIAPRNSHKAEDSFERFARTWMKKMRKLEARNRAEPTVQAEPERLHVTYLGYGEQFETELRETKHPSVPYIGILRYSERLYRCSDPKAQNCIITATTPVTEIFRFQEGRWIY